MKPEWFIFIAWLLAFIVGLLWTIAARLNDIYKLLKHEAAANEHKEGKDNG